METLRARAFRSVSLLAPAGAAPVVVKRFHHPNRWLALLDRARARREFETLSALERAGFPVPRPLELVVANGVCEVRLAAIEGARTLRELMESGEAPPRGWEALLVELGELLARLQAQGWEHGDLHAGNVLVDRAGKAWLIDVQRARRRRPDAARALGEVVECAAQSREWLSARTRARFLGAWLAALPAEIKPGLGGAELGAVVEARARELRVRKVRVGLGRWLRASSRVRRVVRGSASTWVRQDLADAAVGAPGEGWLEVRGAREEVEARWLGAARLHEHRVAVARPAVLCRGARRSGRGAWAWFEPPREEVRVASVEALREELVDRGLELVEGGRSAVQTDAGWFFAAPREPGGFRE